jgi:hypothetical protein
MTQFAYACHQLGIDLQCNSDPDFKPKVERANQTLQGMLPFRFSLEDIHTIDEANAFLQDVFIPVSTTCSATAMTWWTASGVRSNRRSNRAEPTRSALPWRCCASAP